MRYLRHGLRLLWAVIVLKYCVQVPREYIQGDLERSRLVGVVTPQ